MRINNVHIDDVTGFRTNVKIGTGIAEQMTHEGYMYGVYLDVIDADAGQNLDILVEVGSKPLHLSLTVEALGGLARVLGYAYPTYATKGTPINFNPYNGIASKAKPLLSKAYLGPTGVVVDPNYMLVKPNGRLVLGAGQGVSKVNSQLKETLERVIPEGVYLLRYTALVAGVTMTLSGVIYEEII